MLHGQGGDGEGVGGLIATINHCPGPPGAFKRP